MKRRQELAEEAERQRIKEEQEAKAASEAAEQAKREAERRDDVDVGASHDDSGIYLAILPLYTHPCPSSLRSSSPQNLTLNVCSLSIYSCLLKNKQNIFTHLAWD